MAHVVGRFRVLRLPTKFGQDSNELERMKLEYGSRKRMISTDGTRSAEPSLRYKSNMNASIQFVNRCISAGGQVEM